MDHFDEIVSTDKNPIYDELFAYARGQSKTVFQTELDQIKEDMLNDLRDVFHQFSGHKLNDKGFGTTIEMQKGYFNKAQ